MLSAISRYGARWLPDADAIIEGCRRRGALIEGPQIGEFEAAFTRRLGGGHAATTSHGRMAFYYILKALDLPVGSEIVFPALTFWVVPEMARAAGLVPVFADVDPVSFNLCPESLQRAITPRTRAIVPTHIYGLPCDMHEIMAIARAHHLRVIEDCAHSLGSSYHGQPMGTFGDAALFSFQVLKPLNTHGGGIAYTRDPELGEKVARIARAEPWPTEERVLSRLRMARVERALMHPAVFSLTGFPILWAASFFGATPDVYLWEKIRPLHPFPPSYPVRYPNAQAALGLAALERLADWTETTRAHAAFMSDALRDLPGVKVPPAPTDRVHVYYQYPVYVADRVATVRGCLRSGLDVEYHHMDVCSDLPHFAASQAECLGARQTRDAVQLPIHVGLSQSQLEVVAARVRRVIQAGVPARAAVSAGAAR